jgi:hypothetical protein
LLGLRAKHLRMMLQGEKPYEKSVGMPR